MPDGNSKPSDFDGYWQHTLDELARHPARPETDVIPIRCTDFATMYGVRLTSIGPYRLFAYLSIPKGQGPFPAIYYVARYGSVLETIPQGTSVFKRSRYVTLSIAGRGQRNADQPFAAMYPGSLTEGIHDHQSYTFRGIAADCVRGLEYLLTRSEVDTSRVVAWGNDMAIIAAALHGGASHVLCTPALFFDAAELAPRTNEYPLEEINDYLRLYPERRDAVHRTLSYFNLRWLAPRVEASTLLMADAPGGLLDREALAPLVAALQGEVVVHDSEQSSYKDGIYGEEWVARKLGFQASILPEHWR